MRLICRLFFLLFGLAYLAALAILAIGNFGLFGQQRDPLSGIYLLPLGLPWNRMIDIFPEPLWPWLAAAAPGLNLLIIWALCRWAGRRSNAAA